MMSSWLNLNLSKCRQRKVINNNVAVVWILFIFVSSHASIVRGLSRNSNNNCNHCNEKDGWSRRQVLQQAAITTASSSAIVMNPRNAFAGTNNESTNSSILKGIPRVGYSFFKTSPDMAAQCAYLALQAGVRHLDVATFYQSNKIVGEVLEDYIQHGMPELDKKGNPLPTSAKQPTPFAFLQSFIGGDTQQEKRRKELFVTHKIKISGEQKQTFAQMKEDIYNQMNELRLDYLDMVMIHSPLNSSKDQRLNTYQALLELKNNEQIVRRVGVCNYGVNPLNEIKESNLSSPEVIQLELSPFNQHKDVAEWAKLNGSLLSCGAWSRLSGVDGPKEGWNTVADIAKEKGVTKAQVLVRWALQSDILCVPRSGAGSKLERQAIFENSLSGVSTFTLSREEINILNGLDEQYMAGRLKRMDGWTEQDMPSSIEEQLRWDPTLAV